MEKFDLQFKTFCECSLSNDLIAVVENIMGSKPDPSMIKPAYKYLLEDNELLEKQIDRFTCVEYNKRVVILVTLK